MSSKRPSDQKPGKHVGQSQDQVFPEDPNPLKGNIAANNDVVSGRQNGKAKEAGIQTKKTK